MDVFELGFRIIVPIGLILVMFGMGLGLGADDFHRVIQNPAAATAGIAGQLILLPILAFAITAIVPMQPEIAVGLIVIAACPGGVASNAIVFAAKADVALSVSLTAINSLVTVFTIPFVVSLGVSMHFGSSDAILDLPVLDTILQLFSITVFPISLGMFVRWRSRILANALLDPARVGSMIILTLIVIGVIALQVESFLANVAYAGFSVLLLNLAAMAAGYSLAYVVRLNAAQKTTVAIEIGLQNGTLAVLVALNLLQMKEVAIVPSVYAAVMLVTGGLFAVLMRRQQARLLTD